MRAFEEGWGEPSGAELTPGVVAIDHTEDSHILEVIVVEAYRRPVVKGNFAATTTQHW